MNAAGVVAAACPSARTGRYLVAEGGVCAGHKCVDCDADMKAAAAQEAAAAKGKGGAAKGKACDCKPVPVDVMLVPQCKK